MAGSTVTARWEARSPGVAYCFEQQPLLPGASKQGICTQRDFPAKSIHVEKGKGAPHPSLPPGAGSWQGFNQYPRFLPQEHWTRQLVTAWPCTAGPRRGAGPPSPCSTTTPATVRMETRSTRSRFNCKKGNSRQPPPYFFFLHPPPSHAASLARPIHINASDATIVLQWSPSPRAACPGALAKYLICHVAKGDNVTCECDTPVPMGQGEGWLPPGYSLLLVICPDAEADAAASHFALQNLRPGTTYKVGVWEVTAESGRTCSTSRDFHTKALGNGWRPRPFPGPRGVLSVGCSPSPLNSSSVPGGVPGTEMPPPSCARPQERCGNPT